VRQARASPIATVNTDSPASLIAEIREQERHRDNGIGGNPVDDRATRDGYLPKEIAPVPYAVVREVVTPARRDEGPSKGPVAYIGNLAQRARLLQREQARQAEKQARRYA